MVTLKNQVIFCVLNLRKMSITGITLRDNRHVVHFGAQLTAIEIPESEM